MSVAAYTVYQGHTVFGLCSPLIREENVLGVIYVSVSPMRSVSRNRPKI
jgi:hypothetical protein